MNELIQITTGGQGSPVVKSARELHQFLGVKSKFADWFKNRVAKYNFVEEQDFVTLSKNLENGGRELDYALSLDMAKELAMVERTQKGKQARQYFIEKEKELRQVLTSSTTTEQALLQLMSQTNQLMANQQQLLADLRADVDELKNNQSSPPPTTPPPHLQAKGQGQQLGLPGIPTPRPTSAASLRQTIHRHVTDYSAYYGATIQITYGYLYRRLFEVYSISAHRLNRQPNESLLDVLERYGQLQNLYALVTAELLYPHD